MTLILTAGDLLNKVYERLYNFDVQALFKSGKVDNSNSGFEMLNISFPLTY